MTLIGVLAVLAVAQSIFLVLLAIAMRVNRQQNRRRMLAGEIAEQRIGAPLREWLVSGGTPDQVVEGLRTLTPHDAASVLIRVVATRLTPQLLAELATAVRPEPWVDSVLRGADSWFWWKRVESARLLTVIGLDQDRARLTRLLNDRYPAVQVVAGSALARIGGTDAVSAILDNLPDRSRFVRLQHCAVLREHWAAVVPLLHRRLRDERDAARLLVWVRLADSLQVPELFPVLCALSGSADSLIREAVAMSLRNYFHPDAERTLLALMSDVSAAVRAAAAHALGQLGATVAVPKLATSLYDPSWIVRFRSAGALAQLGESGRNALRQARAGADRYAADMAAMIAGLSPGALDDMVAD